MRRFLGVLTALVVAAGFVGSPAWAQNENIITIALTTTVQGGAPGSVVPLTDPVPTAGLQGKICGVVAESTNNGSTHPNTDLLVQSGGGTVELKNVESGANVVVEATGTLTLGPTVSVSVRLGSDGQFSAGIVVTIDCSPPLGVCDEDVNPHGQTTPPAGSSTLPGARGGQNEDGFYKISSTTGVQVFVVDTGSGTVFGPYPSGTVVKYTEANGATPNEKKIGSTNGQAGAVLVHITGTGDMGVSTSMTGMPRIECLVPPPPK